MVPLTVLLHFSRGCVFWKFIYTGGRQNEHPTVTYIELGTHQQRIEFEIVIVKQVNTLKPIEW